MVMVDPKNNYQAFYTRDVTWLKRHIPNNTNNTSSPYFEDDNNTDAVGDDAAAAVGINTGTKIQTQKSDHQSGDSSKKEESKTGNIQNNNHDNHTSIDLSDEDDKPDGRHEDGDEPTDEARWNEMYERLVAYKKQYKTTCVPQSYNATCGVREKYKSTCVSERKYYTADPHLGAWVDQQRKDYLADWVMTQYTNYHPDKRTFRVTEERIQRLESLGFVWDILDAQWEVMYERLVAYKKQYHSTSVPREYELDPPLGRWVQKQRKNYNNPDKQNARFTKERIQRLDAIGFVWRVLRKNIKDAQWTVMYERLVAYKQHYKSTCVPRSYAADPKLGQWVSTQRSNYHTRSSHSYHLTTERKQQLNRIGFVWKVTHAANKVAFLESRRARNKKNTTMRSKISRTTAAGNIPYSLSSKVDSSSTMSTTTMSAVGGGMGGMLSTMNPPSCPNLGSPNRMADDAAQLLRNQLQHPPVQNLISTQLLEYQLRHQQHLQHLQLQQQQQQYLQQQQHLQQQLQQLRHTELNNIHPMTPGLLSSLPLNAIGQRNHWYNLPMKEKGKKNN